MAVTSCSSLTPAVAETMRQLRVALRHALAGRTIEQAAGLAGCSPTTVSRILRGHDVRILTAARICDHLGVTLVVQVAPKHNML